MSERLDEEKIEVLRHWGEGLARDAREELRAAGRAILLLIEEIEQLQVDMWNERSIGTTTPLEQETRVPEPDIESSLLKRLTLYGRRRSEEAPQ